jgi:glycosyltransferase involved in cell wall biosynthesis
MNILYISYLCSKRKFDDIFINSRRRPEQQVQKYHRLVVEGLVTLGNNITCLSSLPVSRNILRKYFFKCEKEQINEVTYVYAPFINLVVIRHICLFVYCFLYATQWCQKNKNGAVICDGLNISASAATLLAAKLFGRKNIGIVTDIPGFMVANEQGDIGIFKAVLRRTIIAVNSVIIHSFGYYVLLTDHMNTLVNKNNRPFVVIEGQVDVNMGSVENSLHGKHHKQVCMYTGALHRRYGLHLLVDGFLKADVQNAELHIYGTGSYENELIELCKAHTSIRYFGVVPNEVVVKEQLKATLLINPRPSTEEFTKYSFPSKNMEYMASGTPVLTTNLPGMPEEYGKYVFLIDNETIDGIAEKIRNILAVNPAKLHGIGLKAKEFVLKEKNNHMQARKILTLLQSKEIQ